MKSEGILAGARLISVGEKIEFTAEDLKKIQEMSARYPERASAVMPVLWLAQERFGFISEEAVELVANALEIPREEVASVVTFYTMYHLEPVGKHVIQVCVTSSCSMLGADALVVHLKKRLGIDIGDTTPDGKFTLKKVECLASCGTAPVIQINEEKYHESLDLEAIDRLLDSLPGAGQ